MNSFNEERTTIWSFKERGDWATHNGDYPGNCSPYIIKNILLKYSKEEDIVLDQFVGSGTTIMQYQLQQIELRVLMVNVKYLKEMQPI